jgi:hypothetical protein
MDFPQHGEIFYFYGQALHACITHKPKSRSNYPTFQSVPRHKHCYGWYTGVKNNRCAISVYTYWKSLNTRNTLRSTIQQDNVSRTSTLLKYGTFWDSIFEKRTLISI